uniref:TNFR-Cys domain-containing protein n=1 Tax=Anopheles epiroticus TaxID=199890 RepID=A0A182PWX2_9DIPT
MKYVVAAFLLVVAVAQLAEGGFHRSFSPCSSCLKPVPVPHYRLNYVSPVRCNQCVEKKCPMGYKWDGCSCVPDCACLEQLATLY